MCNTFEMMAQRGWSIFGCHYLSSALCFTFIRLWRSILDNSEGQKSKSLKRWPELRDLSELKKVNATKAKFCHFLDYALPVTESHTREKNNWWGYLFYQLKDSPVKPGRFHNTKQRSTLRTKKREVFDFLRGRERQTKKRRKLGWTIM